MLGTVEIIAHRGASYDAPENTLAAFCLGWEQQADGCELDIRLTGDHQVIVIHDSSTRRTTGTRRIVGRCTLAEVQALDAGSFKGPQWQGEKLPALADVAATIPEGRRLLMELKCGSEVLPALEQVLAGSGKRPEQLVIIGFDAKTLALARQRFPHLQIYLLGSLKRRKAAIIDELIAQARAIGATGLDLEADVRIDSVVVNRVHKAGLHLLVWTVDDDQFAARLARAGVDGITTNRPGWMRQRLGDAGVLT